MKKKGTKTTEKSISENEHNELELIIVPILLGLLGIAFFAWYVGFGVGENVRTLTGSDNVVVETPTDTVNLEVDDVVGRDKEILGLTIDTVNGKFFTHPKTKKTLYILKSGVCEGECLAKWEPYMADKTLKGESISTIGGQYTWKGSLLYTFKDDKRGDILGNGNGWVIARP